MPRFARIGLLAIVLLVLLGIGAWWLLQTGDAPPRSPSLAAVQDSVSIRWNGDGLAAINAANDLDALASLGYVHGLRRGWTASLWRQTAKGELSHWFGVGVLPIDRHARRLELAHRARAAYERLPPPIKKRLRAYAGGLNAALQSELVRDRDAFVLMDVEPDPWKPWHTLAVERLLAWLATPPLNPPNDAPAAVKNFHDDDHRLRRWLHLHDWHRSVAWAVRSAPADTLRSVLFQRHVLGATAAPVIQSVAVDRPDAPRLKGASFPGVPIFPTGSSGERAWASLLRGTARLDRIPFDSSRVKHRYERLSPSNGDEELLHVRDLNSGLLLDRSSPSAPSTDDTGPPPPKGDTTRPKTAWVMRWSGRSATTDLPAWLQRAGFSAHSDSTTFTLFEPDGLRVSSDSTWTILGTPAVTVRDSAKRVLVGNTQWARHQAQSLRARHRLDASLNVQQWSASDSSTWAAELFPRMAPAVNRLSATHPDLRNVATYLRNWDNTYDPLSIGATIFDRWMRVYQKEVGHHPRPRNAAAYFSTYRQHRALLRALDTLQATLGPDVRQWRWERAVPDRRFFPVWSADSLVEDDLGDLSTTQYAPLHRRGRGHPSALSGGLSLVDTTSTAPSPTAWEGWTAPSDSAFTVRRPRYNASASFTGSRGERTRPSPVRLTLDSTAHTTTLVPATGSGEGQ